VTRRLRAAAGVCAAALVVLSAAPAGAKEVPPCSLITPDELGPLFEQPFQRGRVEAGDACTFKRPRDADVPNIVVMTRGERYKSVKKAKRAFEESRRITRELAAVEPTPMDGIGDEAFFAYFVGTDQITLRVGRVLVELGVDNPDDEETTFPEQTAATALAIATKLSTPKSSTPSTSRGTQPRARVVVPASPRG
jgi:hypothetical protein